MPRLISWGRETDRCSIYLGIQFPLCEAEGMSLLFKIGFTLTLAVAVAVAVAVSVFELF